ncbi:hypothetical protein [Nocardia barduliensis]|uniref:hypothetical protein n=1 Tax=Nocardia barduliensis TaxID=2736643 RepID=UPI0015746145|nr:hypothetical protein [Nocardia barduliensis]
MSDQGKEYASFIAAELKTEHDRRDTANNRAAAALTATTGLITLVAAVFTVLRGKDFILTGPAKATLLLALIAMLITAALSLFAGFAKSYDSATASTLHTMIDTHWTDSEVSARNATARCNIQTLQTLRAGTNFKYRVLSCAGISQMIAVLSLIACTGFAV